MGLGRITAGLLLAASLLGPTGASADPGQDPGQEAGQEVVSDQGVRMDSTERPRVTGDLRYGQSVRATKGRWTRQPQNTKFQWFHAGDPIRGARGQRYTIRPEDVGRRLSVRVMARRDGAGKAWARSRWTGDVGHRVGVRRTVTYQVETRGRIVVSRREFRRQAQETYDDPRGWRGMGVRFVPVRRDGDLSLVLAEADEVPRFSSGCSAQWSCRVGRYVIVNQLRWRTASPAWKAGGGSLRGYRHMVVNHETGHWLGRDHAGCPGRGRPAPVMMQQSKSLDGCRFNPFPTLGELRP